MIFKQNRMQLLFQLRWGGGQFILGGGQFIFISFFYLLQSHFAMRKIFIFLIGARRIASVSFTIEETPGTVIRSGQFIYEAELNLCIAFHVL